MHLTVETLIMASYRLGEYFKLHGYSFKDFDNFLSCQTNLFAKKLHIFVRECFFFFLKTVVLAIFVTLLLEKAI